MAVRHELIDEGSNRLLLPWVAHMLVSWAAAPIIDRIKMRMILRMLDCDQKSAAMITKKNERANDHDNDSTRLRPILENQR
jgi:hypothetical protein